jgi:hypothetical protein
LIARWGWHIEQHTPDFHGLSTYQYQSYWILCNPVADQIKVVFGKGMDASVFNNLAQASDTYSDGQWITTP